MIKAFEFRNFSVLTWWITLTYFIISDRGHGFVPLIASPKNINTYGKYDEEKVWKDDLKEERRELSLWWLRVRNRRILCTLNCQLLGMNCAKPTDFSFSFKGFSMRGGYTDIHSDGWGLCFYEGRGLRAFHDSKAAYMSPIADLVGQTGFYTYNMMAHIRYATAGETSLENVHPFQREMWGIQWCFAHNGDVRHFAKNDLNKLPWLGEEEGERTYNPVGQTDSEAIFCAILNSLKAKFTSLPSLPVLHDYLNVLMQQLAATATSSSDDPIILNFLLACGEHVQFAYSWPGARPGSKVWNGLYYIVREPPFGAASLIDCDYKVDFRQVCSDQDRVAIIATKPLTADEDWVEIKKGELILFDDGRPHYAPIDCFRPELSGHGLLSDVLHKKNIEEDMQTYEYDAFAGADI